MVRFVVALVVLVGWACQREGVTEPAAPAENSKLAPADQTSKAARQIPVAKPPKKVEDSSEKPPCDGMFQLLRKCNKGSRAFRDPRFRNTFIAGCEEERKRPTEYARTFAGCVVAKTCDELRECSEGLRQQATELGPEHVDYLLKNTQRDAAMKFCDDHRQFLSRNEKLEVRCKPLLDVLDEQRKEHQHDGNCNH